ncbi:hypothetical protein DXA37_05585 [Bifidobacterium pseudocatenulatum]|nr:hypothetical protein DXA37_05585 [Bifidobacterium pseudocatenulatum]
MTCCRLFGLHRVVHAPCNAIVHEDNGEMSMSDPALFQPKAPLLPIGLVAVFVTATAAASWGLGLVGRCFNATAYPRQTPPPQADAMFFLGAEDMNSFQRVHPLR